MKRTLITGGAGFIGKHLALALLEPEREIILMDNFFTSSRKSLEHSGARNAHFPPLDSTCEVVRHDVCDPFHIEVDEIYHLACPASPVHYQRNPVRTIETAVLGTSNVLRCARDVGAKIFIASTSEIYGDPEVHPQAEDYHGNVSTLGPRACYDEGKRCAESLAVSYAAQYGVDVRIARIFNTYGPEMEFNDGRVISNFICQALRGEKMTVYGEGKQTRSFCYVSDLVDGIIAYMKTEKRDDGAMVVNLGNPEEHTILEVCDLIAKMVHESSKYHVFKPMPKDDPKIRKPDISRAKEYFGFSPKMTLETGLEITISDFRHRLASSPFLSTH